MSEQSVEQVIRNIDGRVARIEQFLPSLATREELQAAVAVLATKEELQAAVALLATKEELAAAAAPLATKEELRTAIADAIAPLATKEELREEGERSRRHATVLFEDLRDDVRIVLDRVVGLSARVDMLAQR